MVEYNFVYRGNEMSDLVWTAVSIAVLSYIISSCSSSDEYRGFVYPDKDNLAIHQSTGSHKTIEDCRRSARNLLYSMDAIEAGDYECGLNC